MIQYGIMIILVIASLVVRFMHPALTETQLLLQFWPLWLVFLIIAIIFYIRSD